MKKYFKVKPNEVFIKLGCYDEKKLFKLRQKVNELYFNHHLSKNMISRKEHLSKKFVIKWTKSPKQDFFKDNRGWKKGKRRKWSKETEQKIQTIYQSLVNDPLEFYTGASAIADRWIKEYPEIPVPPLITIGRILSDLGLSRTRRKGRNKGAAKYLCYPEHTLFNLLFKRILELDFIGKKYISGRTEPLNFIGASFKKEPRLRHFKRILGETGQEIIDYLRFFFKRFEKPEAVKMDNGFAMAGSSSHQRVISKVPLWLLKQQVIPIYAVPRKPFSQASIEGNNSVFSRKFWNRIEFKSLEEVDEKLEWFNLSSQRYLYYQRPKHRTRRTKKLHPQGLFYQTGQGRQGTIQKSTY